jgi:hypothetical protein
LIVFSCAFASLTLFCSVSFRKLRKDGIGKDDIY